MKENWIIPCNIKQFDVVEHFRNNETAVWKNSFSIHVGDDVYIYIGAPIGELRYKCEVISDDVSEELLKKNEYARVEKKNNNYFSKKVKYIQIKLVKEFEPGLFTYNKLKECGLGQVQIQARVDRKLQSYINQIESER